MASVEEVWRLDPLRYSKWYRVKTKGELEIGFSLVRVTAWVRWFTEGDQLSKREGWTEAIGASKRWRIYHSGGSVWSVLSRDRAIEKEQGNTRRKYIGTVQSSIILVNGISKSNTRLRHADDLPYNVKCPVILPKRNHVTRLIIKYYHELKDHQMGLNYTINHVREKYLEVHVSKQVKRVIMRQCFECARRFRSKPAHQQMALLPKIRLQQSSRPFESCTVDFGGPFLTKQGRGRVRTKLYLCFFLCLKTLGAT